PPRAFTAPLPIDLGAAAADLGLHADPITATVTATLQGGLTLGWVPGSLTVFVAPDAAATPSHLQAGVSVSADVSDKAIGVSLLEAKFANPSTLAYSGSLNLKLTDADPDRRLT